MPGRRKRRPEPVHRFGGDWTSAKLDVLKGYLGAYATALKSQPFRIAYIDAFAGTGLLPGEARRLDNAAGTFMAVSVDCLFCEQAAHDHQRGALYAIAHRYEANGDLVPDPDVEFYVVADPDAAAGRAVYPTAIDHGPLGYYRYIHFDSVGQPVRVASRGQAQLARFCDVWMRNITFQQSLGCQEER